MSPNALTWTLIAAAVTMTGRPPGPRVSGGRAELSARTLRLLVGFAAAAGCLAAFGPGRGAIAALVVVPVAAGVIGHLRSRPPRARASPALALCLDLVVVALRAGRPLDAALLLAAPAAGPSGAGLARVGGLLRLGADPGEAWAAVDDDPLLGSLAAAARRSATSGVRLAGAFTAQAAELRAGLQAAAHARAERVGVLVAAPLGLCFLPSFLCLGIAPALIGLARTNFLR